MSTIRPSHAGRQSAHDGDVDTIVAISTPPGRGGVGVVRLSGPQAIAIARRLFRWRKAGAAVSGDAAELPDPAHARFGLFIDAGGETLDDGYLITFKRPQSFTGEDTAEMWAHGSPAVLSRLLAEAVATGARQATPGEFSMRAFLNGRIDITQAEAIRDLIEARTSFQARVARSQIDGRISREVDGRKARLADLIARLEASIEFSEEGEADRFLPEGGAMADVRGIRKELELLAETFDRGRRIREGVSVAIVGRPNVGKSSLFNRLLEEERAIVAPAAGTTRDLLEETLVLDGIPVALTDTAGLHDARGVVDVEAVRRSQAAFDSADWHIVVLDWSTPIEGPDSGILERVRVERAIVVLNKADLPCGIGLDRVIHLRKRFSALEVSARTGEGIGDLRRRLTDSISSGPASEETACLTNVRHYGLVLNATGALKRAEMGSREGSGEEYILVDLKEALDRLGEITGEVGVEDIYDRIFSTFCIGK